MNNQFKKRGLEIYGLLRMTWGIAQLAGLCFSYFLLEFVIRYPSSQLAHVFDQDVLAFIFLAVIFRGGFHLIVGIGIARFRKWVNFWIFWGWPFIVIINIGVFYVHFHDFSSQGYISSVAEMIKFGNLVFYAALIFFDCFFITAQMDSLDSDSALEDLGGRLQASKVFISFIVVLIFFCALLFLSNPLKKGFHQGFYKSRGKVSEAVSPKKVIVPKYKTDSKKYQVQAQGKTMLVEGTVKEMRIDDQTQTGSLKLLKKTKRKNIPKGLPYKGTIGACSGVSIVIGLLMQLFWVGSPGFQGSNSCLLAAYTFLSLGFLLGVVFAKYSDLTALFFLGVICFLISLATFGRLVMQGQNTE